MAGQLLSDVSLLSLTPKTDPPGRCLFVAVPVEKPVRGAAIAPAQERQHPDKGTQQGFGKLTSSDAKM